MTDLEEKKVKHVLYNQTVPRAQTRSVFALENRLSTEVKEHLLRCSVSCSERVYLEQLLQIRTSVSVATFLKKSSSRVCVYLGTMYVLSRDLHAIRRGLESN